MLRSAKCKIPDRRWCSTWLRATFLWWCLSAIGSVKFSLNVRCRYMIPVRRNISAVDVTSLCASTTIHTTGARTSRKVCAIRVNAASLNVSLGLVVVTIISNPGGFESARSSSMDSGCGSGRDCVRISGMVWVGRGEWRVRLGVGVFSRA